MTHSKHVTWALVWWIVIGCSGGSGGRGLHVGNEPGAGRGGAGISGGAGNASGTAGDLGSEGNALSLSVREPGGLKIELVTLSCAGECAEVEAVARGGNPPYAFAWQDGSTSATRELCPTATTTFEVSATDTAIESDEFHYEAQTTHAEVTAKVLKCNADGGVADAGPEPNAECILTEFPPATQTIAVPWEVCGPYPEVTWPTAPVPRCDEPVIGGDQAYARFVAYDGAPAEQEGLGGRLCAALEANVSRVLSIRLAGGFSADGLLSSPGYDTPVSVELWGGDSPCDKGELLWTSPTEPGVSWGTDCVRVTPTRRHTHLRAVIHMTAPLLTHRLGCITLEFGEVDGVCAP